MLAFLKDTERSDKERMPQEAFNRPIEDTGNAVQINVSLVQSSDNIVKPTLIRSHRVQEDPLRSGEKSARVSR